MNMLHKFVCNKMISLILPIYEIMFLISSKCCCFHHITTNIDAGRESLKMTKIGLFKNINNFLMLITCYLTKCLFLLFKKRFLIRKI